MPAAGWDRCRDKVSPLSSSCRPPALAHKQQHICRDTAPPSPALSELTPPLQVSWTPWCTWYCSPASAIPVIQDSHPAEGLADALLPSSPAPHPSSLVLALSRTPRAGEELGHPLHGAVQAVPGRRRLHKDTSNSPNSSDTRSSQQPGWETAAFPTPAALLSAETAIPF